MINALLGGSFLADGILPTTNEISVLKFRWASLCMPATSRSAVAVPQRVCSFRISSPRASHAASCTLLKVYKLRWMEG